jgi:hypothetical protein
VVEYSILERDKMHIGDFIDGKCAAAKESDQFVRDWLGTNGNPCSVCGAYKPKCSFFKKVGEKKAVGEVSESI